MKTFACFFVSLVLFVALHGASAKPSKPKPTDTESSADNDETRAGRRSFFDTRKTVFAGIFNSSDKNVGLGVLGPDGFSFAHAFGKPGNLSSTSVASGNANAVAITAQNIHSGSAQISDVNTTGGVGIISYNGEVLNLRARSLGEHKIVSIKNENTGDVKEFRSTGGVGIVGKFDRIDILE